jgi:polyisoprenyl-phosphate glycosyltransferase
MPVYDDWDAAALVLSELDGALGAAGESADVLLVDDGSTTTPPADFARRVAARHLHSLSVLTLRRNLGHQRAIGIALARLASQGTTDLVVVMDADGQDAPADVPRLAARARQAGLSRIVFGERRRRSESAAFTLLYHVYRALHLALTGIPVRVGNFSAVPGALLGRLAVTSELWNHYAAAVFKARVPYETIPVSRRPRLAGRSRMDLPALVAHGLGALSVHSELVGARLLILTSALAVLLTLVAAAGFAGSWLAGRALPSWVGTAGLIALVLVPQAVMFSFAAAFVVLHGRSDVRAA